MSNLSNYMRDLWRIKKVKSSLCVSIYELTIRILEKFNKPSGVKSGVPSSMNDKSVKYIPRYGIHGGSQRWRASRITLNLPSEQTTACSFVIVDLIYVEVISKVSNCSKLPIAATHILGNLVPRFLETEYWRTGERCTDLQYSVEVMQASTDVSNCCPLLNGCNSRRHGSSGNLSFMIWRVKASSESYLKLTLAQFQIQQVLSRH